MWTNIRYILLTALRDRLFLALVVGVSASTWISAVLGSTAMVEVEQMRLVFAAASARVIVMVGLAVFVCFHVRYIFDTKEIDVLLSRPLSRESVVLSCWLGFACVALLLVAPVVALLGYLGVLQPEGFAAWSASLALEALTVLTMALFVSFMLGSAVSSVLLTLGFYVLSRMIGFFLATAQSHMLFDALWINTLGHWTIQAVAMVVPRLDFYAKSDWLVYGVPHWQEYAWFSLQSAVFIPLLLLVAIVDFRRKQF